MSNYAPAATYAPAYAPAPSSTYAASSAQSAQPPLEGAPFPSDEPEHESKHEKEGPLGPVRVGLLVGAGLPGLFSFGGMIKVTRYFATGVNVGLIPSMRLSLYGDAVVSYQHYELYGSLFPFGGSVFLGAGIGYANMSGSITNNINVAGAERFGVSSPLSVETGGSVKTLVLTPKVGLLHTFSSGFTVGIDLGADIPVAPSAIHSQTNVPPSVPPALIQQYVTPNDQKVHDTLEKIGRTILPSASLRIGWMI